MKKTHFIYLMLFLSVTLTGREKMNITPLESLLCDQTSEPIKIFMSRMRVALMMFYWMNATHNLLI